MNRTDFACLVVRLSICSDDELHVLERVLAGFEQNRKHVAEGLGVPPPNATDYPSAWELEQLEKLEAGL